MQYPSICLEELEKTMKTSVKIAGLWAEIEPGHRMTVNNELEWIWK
jgi:hypothetical protein